MKKTPLTKEQYTNGMKALTSHELATHDKQLVSAPVALALLSNKAGRELDRSIIVQLCRYGRLRPYGKYRNTYYFWKRDIEKIKPQVRPKKEEEEQHKHVS